MQVMDEFLHYHGMPIGSSGGCATRVASPSWNLWRHDLNSTSVVLANSSPQDTELVVKKTTQEYISKRR
jgi:hypothetical protein